MKLGIKVVIVAGIIVSMLIGIIIGNEIGVCHRDSAVNNLHVSNVWDCEEGCLYAEWTVYGYKNLSKPSKLFMDCSYVCREGEGGVKR